MTNPDTPQRSKGAKNLFRSFGFAFNGLSFAVGGQRNILIHLCIGSIVIAGGLFFQATPGEWCILVIMISLVLAMEVMNTAVEKLVDFVSPEYHRQAGIIKDLSAGAVLITAFAAVIVGIIIFLPKII